MSLYVQLVLVISCQTRLFEYRELMDSSTYMDHTPVILNTVARLINSFLETTSIVDLSLGTTLII